MTMQFIKIGNLFLNLESIQAVRQSEDQSRVIVYMPEEERISLLHDEAKAVLGFLALRTLDLMPESQEQEPTADEHDPNYDFPFKD